MDFELQAASEVGRSFVSLCESHEKDFFSRATENDREGRFPEENTADLIKSGVMRATAPRELGGLGVVSMRDHIAGFTRLGRGDGSTAIATNMHLYRVWLAARAWRAARIIGEPTREAAVAAVLRQVASGDRIFSIIATENGADVLSPRAEAIRDSEGWRLNGRKAFATGSQASTTLTVRLRYKDSNGDDRVGTADLSPDAPGVKILGNWDALGMRGSGSHDVTFENVFIPSNGIADGGPWGELSPGYMISSISGVMGLAAAFLGIAEKAHSIALRQIIARERGNRSAIQHLVAEMEIDLAAARAMLERSATHADTLFDTHPVTIPNNDLRAMVKDFQCTKQFVTRKAIDIVDHAMTLSGGSGYMTGNPLSRLYRDVRAGPFMQPFSPVDAFELIGKIALGIEV